MVWTVNNQCTFIELGCPLQAESGNRHVIHYTTPERQAPPPAYYYAHIKPCISVPASVSVCECVCEGWWMNVHTQCLCVFSSQLCCRRGARSWVASSCYVTRRTGRTSRRERSPCSPAWTAWSPGSLTGQWGLWHVSCPLMEETTLCRGVMMYLRGITGIKWIKWQNNSHLYLDSFG